MKMVAFNLNTFWINNPFQRENNPPSHSTVYTKTKLSNFFVTSVSNYSKLLSLLKAWIIFIHYNESYMRYDAKRMGTKYIEILLCVVAVLQPSLKYDFFM